MDTNKLSEYQANLFFPEKIIVITHTDDDGLTTWLYADRENAVKKAKRVLKDLLDSYKDDDLIDQDLDPASDAYEEIVHESTQWRVEMGTRGPGLVDSYSPRCSVFIDMEPYPTIYVTERKILDI